MQRMLQYKVKAENKTKAKKNEDKRKKKESWNTII